MRGCRPFEDEACPAVRAVLRGGLSPVQCGNLIDDCEAEAGTGFRSSVCPAGESTEESGDLFLVKTRTVV